jgi:hypothetical protein
VLALRCGKNGEARERMLAPSRASVALAIAARTPPSLRLKSKAI